MEKKVRGTGEEQHEKRRRDRGRVSTRFLRFPGKVPAKVNPEQLEEGVTGGDGTRGRSQLISTHEKHATVQTLRGKIMLGGSAPRPRHATTCQIRFKKQHLHV